MASLNVAWIFLFLNVIRGRPSGSGLAQFIPDSHSSLSLDGQELFAEFLERYRETGKLEQSDLDREEELFKSMNMCLSWPSIWWMKGIL